MKAAVEGLLRAQDLPGEVVCSQPGPEWAPAGSVVQLQLRLGDGTGLTIHMNAAVPPDWVWRSIHSPEVSHPIERLPRSGTSLVA
ncbi:hypothetical protein ACFVYV_37790 [Streptomyces mirabilis]|uniref:hypothetical protein n=1 Tax=Streptomyces mirabilis TaxID=68239 RepID=UPI0036DBD281